MRRVLALILLLSTALATQAAPISYALEPDESTVGFETDFGAGRIKGTMPILSAELMLDFDDVSQSRVAVRVSVRAAQAGIPFATEALKGGSVLDAQRYPEIAFASRRVRSAGDGAVVDGDITIRGVTRPVRLTARLYRQHGTRPGDLSQLSILLTGAVRRSDFGSTGFSGQVGDEVRLRILARIERRG
ncbi:MAG: YceI family protein [Paracoccaceae bacterium]